MYSLKWKIKDKVLELRRLEYLISTSTFERCYECATGSEKTLLDWIPLTVEAYEMWMMPIKRRNPKLMNLRELRTLASELKIKNYARISSYELRDKVCKELKQN